MALPIGSSIQPQPPLAGALPLQPAQPTQPTLVQQMMAGGYPMDKFTLIALTLFPPTGIACLNLQVLKNTAGARLKVGSYVATSLWAVRLMSIYPSILTKALCAALFLGPWYLFDAMNILFNPDFPREGFQPPVPVPGFPPPAPTDGSWLLTPVLLSLILATLPAGALGATGILNQYAPGLVGGDVQKYIGYAVAGTAGLGAAFSLFSANKAPTQLPLQPLQGGGSSGTGKNNDLPPLSSFAKSLMRSTSPQAFQESLTFLGILGIVVGGGILLSLVRSSAVARETDSKPFRPDPIDETTD